MTGPTIEIGPALAQRRRQRALEQAMQIADDPRTPEMVARRREVARELGVPDWQVPEDPEAWSARVDTLRTQKALERTPELGRWIAADPARTPLARDDLGALGDITDALRAFGEVGDDALDHAMGRALERGALRTAAAPAQFGVFNARRLKSDMGLSEGEIERRLREANPTLGVLEAKRQARMRWAQAQDWRGREDEIEQGIARDAEMVAALQDISRGLAFSPEAQRAADAFEAAQTWGDIGSVILDDPVGVGSFLGQVGAESVPMLIGATAATAVTGSPAAGAAVMGATSYVTEASSSALEFLQEEGVDTADPKALRAAYADPELMARAQARGVARAMPIAIMDALSGGIASRTLARSPLADVLLQTGAQAGFGAGGEALAQVNAGQEISLSDIVIEGLAEIVTLPIEVGGVGGRALRRDARRAARGGETRAELERIEEAVGRSKLRERDGPAFADFLRRMPGSTVFLPAADAQTYFQQQDIAPADWGIDAEALGEIALAGGAIPVPTSVFAERIANTAHAEWFKRTASSDPEAVASEIEAEAFNAQVRDALDDARAEMERDAARDRESRASDRQVFDQVFSELRAAGRAVDAATAEAETFTAFFRTLAARYGEDPLDLYRQFAPRVAPGVVASPAARRRDQLDILLNSLRAGARDRPGGPTVIDRLREWGGVSDEGGDVAAMDPPKGLVAETREQVRARRDQATIGGMPEGRKGLGLDDALLRLVEAQMLPEGATTNDVLEAIGEEIAGRPRYALGEEPDTTLADLAEELSRRGIDVSAMTNDEIVAALEAQDGQALFQFAGPRAETAPGGFDEALVMQAEGASPEEIRARTGWEVGADGALRFEISDDAAAVAGPLAAEPVAPFTARLEDVIDHPDLFLAYPQLRDVSVAVVDGFKARHGGVAGVFAPEPAAALVGALPRIEIDLATMQDPRATPDLRLAALLHEVQHVIQAIEGFESGAAAGRGYARSAGEAEARNTQRRRGMTADERAATPAVVTEDVPRAEQIVEVRTASPEAVEAARERIAARRLEDEEARQEERAAAERAGREARIAAVVAALDPADVEYLAPPDEGPTIETLIGLALDGDPLDQVFPPWKMETVERVVAPALEAQDGQALLQDDGKAGPRGSITFPAGGIGDGQTVIRLFETADLSTFFHETAHFQLEAFAALAAREDAPQQMQEDLAKIRAWLGAEDGAAFTVDQHEKFARGFEAYMMKGEAPSLALADAFARAKQWLLRVYRTIRALDVEVTPEIAEVMDRLLATDAEIAEARGAAAMRPLFETEADAAMSGETWAAYSRMARRATEQAEAALAKKTLAAVRRRRAAEYREERERVRAEVDEEIGRRREHRLVEDLANDETRDGLRIDRDALVEMFGPGVLPELSRARLGGRRAIYKAKGAGPREVASMYGFRSATEMVEALQNAGKRREAVEAETDRRMQERYGDPLEDGSVEAEAFRAIHSEQQARLVAAEARALARRASRPEKGLTVEAARVRAREMIGKMKVADAQRAGVFAAAERKARMEAERAFRRLAQVTAAGGAAPLGTAPGRAEGDMGRLSADELLQEALAAKQRELVQHMLWRESMALRDYVRTRRKKLADYSKPSVRKALAGDYIAQIDDLVKAFDFRVLTGRQVTRRANLAAFVEKMRAEGREAELAIDERLVEEADLVHYTQMSVDQLQGLVDTIANIDHLGRMKQKLIEEKAQRDLDAVVEGVVANIAENLPENPPARGTPPASEQRGRTAREYLNSVLNADTLLRRIDGWKDRGAAFMALKASVDAAEVRLVERRRKIAEDLEALFGMYTRAEQAEMNRLRSIPQFGDELSKWDLIAIALNTGNADNWQRLTHEKNPLAVRTALSENLDDRDWRFVQAVWDHVETYWPEIEAKEKRLTGVGPKKVRPQPMIERPGLRGGYYPIKYEPRLSGRIGDLQARDLAEATAGGRFGKAQTKNGHVKARANAVKQPVRFDIGVLGEHLNDVVYDLEMGEAVANAWRILKDPRVRDAMIERGRSEDLEALDVWITDVAVGNRVTAKGVSKFWRFLRTGFVFSRLALNVSTALLQPSGLLQSSVVIGKRTMLNGMASYLRSPARWAREVAAASPMMADRESTFERDIHNILGDVAARPATGRWERFHRDWITPVSFAMMQKAQYYAVDLPTWIAVYEEAVAGGQTEASARELADMKVRLAQGSGFASDLGALQRGTLNADSRLQELPRLMTALGSYMFRKLNIAYERGLQTDFRSPAQVFSLAVDLMLLFTLEAAITAVIKGQWPDEEDDESIPVWLAKQTALGALGTLPIAREFSSALQGYSGGGIGGASIEVMARPFIQAEQFELDKAALRSAIEAAGVGLRLPSAQASRILDALVDDDLALRDDVAPVDLLLGRPKD